MSRYEPRYSEVIPYTKERKPKLEKSNAWPDGMKFEDDNGAAEAAPFYQRLPIPASNHRSLCGSASVRCLEGPGHSSLNK